MAFDSAKEGRTIFLPVQNDREQDDGKDGKQINEKHEFKFLL
jgi:hypothetical protein